MRLGLAVAALSVFASARVAAADPTIYMERHGARVERTAMPAFGGSDATWRRSVACVRDKFAPFRVDITDVRPASGEFITVVVGGKASMRGLDDSSTTGVGPYTGDVIPDAVVNVFSQNIGEDNADELCATAAHEIGHALGLDHVHLCGDLMSYYGDACGAERFLDRAAPCGEDEDRDCEGDDKGATQNSYRWLAAKVGLRANAAPPPAPAPTTQDPWDPPTTTAPAPAEDQPADDDTTEDTTDDTEQTSECSHQVVQAARTRTVRTHTVVRVIHERHEHHHRRHHRGHRHDG